MSQQEAFITARKLVEEAVEVATKAGLDPSAVIEPHCPETIAALEHDGRRPGADPPGLVWCGVPVIIDNDTVVPFEMLRRTADPEQRPVLQVTESTAALVRQEFERYRESLERMAENWQEEKTRLLAEAKGRKK